QAEIAGGGAAEEVEELHEHRAVQAEIVALGLEDFLARRRAAEDERDGIAGDQVHGDEDERPGQHQHGDDAEDAPDQPFATHLGEAGNSKGVGSRKRRRTLVVSFPITLLPPSMGSEPAYVIEPTENTAPPAAVSKKVMSAQDQSSCGSGWRWVSMSSLTQP